MVGSTLFVTYKNKLYDLTKFQHKHPGGLNTLKGLNNKDIKEKFEKAQPHSSAALYLMKEYEVKKETNHNGIANGMKGTANGNANGTVNGIGNGNIKSKATESITTEDQIDESMEHLVDWSKPMLRQIGSLKEHYTEWVNKPVDRPLRLFESDLKEMLSKTPWWIIPLIWVPTITYLAYIGWYQAEAQGFGHTHSYLSFGGGIFLWTITEYLMHRFIFHVNTENAGVFLCTFHFLFHGLHHKVPFDPYRLVFPPFPAAVIASLSSVPMYFLFSCPALVLAGFVLGYLCYDMMHYYIHYGSPTFKYTYYLKRSHNQHHFVKPNGGFGISCPMWDVVFGTRLFLRKLNYMLKW